VALPGLLALTCLSGLLIRIRLIRIRLIRIRLTLVLLTRLLAVDRLVFHFLGPRIGDFLASFLTMCPKPIKVGGPDDRDDSLAVWAPRGRTPAVPKNLLFFYTSGAKLLPRAGVVCHETD
jgi:hypothetical protein